MPKENVRPIMNAARKRVSAAEPGTCRPHALLIAAGILWAFPVTLFGLLLAVPAALSRGGRIARVRHVTPAWLVTGPVADRLLGMHPLGNVVAMAIGHIVIARQAHLSRRLLEHELAHVRQATRWGPLFPFAYAASSLQQFCCGRRAYRDNVFEVEARAAEHRASGHGADPDSSHAA